MLKWILSRQQRHIFPMLIPDNMMWGSDLEYDEPSSKSFRFWYIYMKIICEKYKFTSDTTSYWLNSKKDSPSKLFFVNIIDEGIFWIKICSLSCRHYNACLCILYFHGNSSEVLVAMVLKFINLTLY